jgi:hypothetical protein
MITYAFYQQVINLECDGLNALYYRVKAKRDQQIINTVFTHQHISRAKIYSLTKREADKYKKMLIKNKAKAQHIQVAKVWDQTDGTLCVGIALSHCITSLECSRCWP